MMTADWVFRRGDIYLANLGRPEGSRQGGVRPVVLLQNDVGNFYSPTVTLAPLTSQKKKPMKTHYKIKHARGLAKPSIVLAEQMATYDKSCIIRYLGKVNCGQMRGIDEAVKAQLGYYISERPRKWEPYRPHENAQEMAEKKTEPEAASKQAKDEGGEIDGKAADP